MTEVLIISAGVPGAPAELTEAVAQMHADGARVVIAVGCPTDRITVPQGAAEMIGLPSARSLPPDDRRAHRAATQGRKLWLRARRDPRLRRLARSADVIVALDAGAAHTVHELARRHRAADGVFDLTSALIAVAEREAKPSRSAVRRIVRRVPSPAVAVDSLREQAGHFARKASRRVIGRAMTHPRGRLAVRALLRAPGLSYARRKALGARMVAKLGSLGLHAEANNVRLAVADRMARPNDRAEWLMAMARDELESGRIPELLTETVVAELTIADEALRREDFEAATRSVGQVLHLMFHRALHFDSLTSVMAPDPTSYLEPLHRSLAGRTMAAPRGRLTPAASTPIDRPQRLLFVSDGNENFLGDIRAHYQQDPRFEIQDLNMSAQPEWKALARLPLLIKHKLGGEPEFVEMMEEWLRPHVDWADTVFIEWSVIHAALFTTIDPGTTRIIIRLHLYEAFTAYPHLIDLSRVDDLVFVSEPLLDFVRDVVPRLRENGAPRTPVVTNAARLERFRRPKRPDARFTLAQIGLSRVGKDPRWTFEVLRELRRSDTRYNLILIGADLEEIVTPQAAAYHHAYRKEASELEADGAIRWIGQTDDVAGALTSVGVVLSSSVRESFHFGVIEGAASGAVPVVRDWPYFAGRAQSARSIFPADWMVDTPREAAERILKHTASEEIWRATGQEAARHAMRTWDWSVVQAQYDRLFQGYDPPE